MEEIILKISQKTFEELKKAHKAPYPLYCKNVFVELVKEEGFLSSLILLINVIAEMLKNFLKRDIDTEGVNLL